MASPDEIRRYENALNAINVVLSVGTSVETSGFLDAWDDAAGMTRRETMKRDLAKIAACDDPDIRSRARVYLSRL